MKIRRIFVLFAVLVCLTCMALGANAVDYYRATAVTLPVNVTVSQQVKSGSIEVKYDSASMELLSGTFSLSGTSIAQFNGSKGVFAFSSPAYIGGNICSLSFRVKDDAPVGQEVTVSATVTLTLTDGSQKVIDVTAGQGTVQCRHLFVQWKKVDDKTHSRTCSCGAKETAEHTWDAGKETESANCLKQGKRVYTCTGCGAQKTEIVPKTGHTYDNGCDGDCNVCGATRTVQHKYSEKMLSNKRYHFYHCSVCGKDKDVEAHIPGPEATEQHAQVCTVCGYVIAPAKEHTHVYGDTMSSDENGHFYTCTICAQEKDRAEHTYTDDCDATCDACGYERTPPHAPVEAWQCDGVTHWHVCAVCGIRVQEAEHTAKDADAEHPVCSVCGGEIIVKVHEHSFTEWIVTVPATENTEGEEMSTCECGETMTRVIPKIGKWSLPVSRNALMRILTEDEAQSYAQGEAVKFSLDIRTINALNEADRALFASAQKDTVSKYQVASYYDIALYMQVGQAEKRQVTDFDGSYEVELTVPEAFVNHDPALAREYRVLQLHDGMATVLYGEYDAEGNLFRFRADGFSEFVLLYADTEVHKTSGGDMALYLACGTLGVAVITSCTIIIVMLRRKYK